MASWHEQWMDAHQETSGLADDDLRVRLRKVLSVARVLLSEDSDTTPGEKRLAGELIAEVRREIRAQKDAGRLSASIRRGAGYMSKSQERR